MVTAEDLGPLLEGVALPASLEVQVHAAAEALKPYRQYALARDMVRYVGDPVAAVFASDPYVAEDAAQTVEIEVTAQPPLMDVSQEPGSFAPGLNTEPVTLTNDGV